MFNKKLLTNSLSNLGFWTPQSVSIIFTIFFKYHGHQMVNGVMKILLAALYLMSLAWSWLPIILSLPVWVQVLGSMKKRQLSHANLLCLVNINISIDGNEETKVKFLFSFINLTDGFTFKVPQTVRSLSVLTLILAHITAAVLSVGSEKYFFSSTNHSIPWPEAYLKIFTRLTNE